VFDTLQYKYTVVELDNRADGHAIQNILEQMTGARTVSTHFWNTKYIYEVRAKILRTGCVECYPAVMQLCVARYYKVGFILI